MSISIDPIELKELIKGSRSIFQALGGTKDILQEEQPTINFAYASVVSIRDITTGEVITRDNIWVKRPGTGEIRAVDFEKLLGKKVKVNIPINTQLTWEVVE